MISPVESFDSVRRVSFDEIPQEILLSGSKVYKLGSKADLDKVIGHYCPKLNVDPVSRREIQFNGGPVLGIA